MIRAYLSMPHRGITDISALHNELMNNPALRAACGFTTYVPSRPTLSRVFCQLKELHGLLESCLSETVKTLSEYLPDLGREVAVDSTMVKTNSNTKREPLSDAEATWGKQHSAQESKGWRWVFGHKAHVVADANYDVPLALSATTGSESDTKYLVPLVKDLQWRPEVVIADRDTTGSTTASGCTGGGSRRSSISGVRRAETTPVGMARVTRRGELPSARADMRGRSSGPTRTPEYACMVRYQTASASSASGRAARSSRATLSEGCPP